MSEPYYKRILLKISGEADYGPDAVSAQVTTSNHSF